MSVTIGRGMTNLLAALEAAGVKVTRQGAGKVTCPVPEHDDRNPSLSIWQTSDGAAFDCKAGCDPNTVIGVLGLDWADLKDTVRRQQETGEWTPQGPAVAVYDYTDESGGLLFQVCRTAGKQFPQRRPDLAAGTGWRWNLNGTRRVLYRLPGVIKEADEGGVVYVVEGEKDVHAIEAAGAVATTAPGGAAAKWLPEYGTVLRSAQVIIVADKDEPGLKHAQQVKASLPGARVVQAAKGKDAAEHLAAGLGLADFVPVDEEKPRATELAAFLAAGDAPYDWIVPGLLEHMDRMILTGAEGHGKMTLLRQMAVQLASGVHPFTLEEMPPLRVLLLDLQESERQLKREMRPLYLSAGGRYAGNLYVRSQMEGLNVLSLDDAAELRDLVAEFRPDVLVAGPVYKLADGDPTEETTGKPVTRTLDEIRVKFGPAMLLEAHSPYANGGAKRAQRPYGWSGWSRWPEFGLCLTETDELAHWRGPRDQRDWPAQLQRGGAWPFTVVTRPRDLLWHQVVKYCTEAGDQLSTRDLGKLTGKSHMTVSRVIDEHPAEWAALANGGSPDAL